MKTTIEHRVLDWIRRQGLVEAGDTVLVALSGGADSVCLLRILLDLRAGAHCAPLRVRVTAAHYNHRLRGEASEGDEAFVRELCQKLDVPLVVGTGDVSGEAKGQGRGIEETAREMRYAFLESAAKELGATKIATGHHADDNVETVLLHLIRGTGLRGLAGIPPRRGDIIRPILPLGRQEIEAYLTAIGQDFTEDDTNRDVTLRRNALRHEVLPRLYAQNPNLGATILRQGEILRQDSRCLDEMAEEAFTGLIGCDALGAPCPVDPVSLGWGHRGRCGPRSLQVPVAELAVLDPAIASRVIRLAIEAAGGVAEAVHVRQVFDIAAGADPSAETTVPGPLRVRRVYDKLAFGDEIRKNPEGFHAFRFKSSAICGKITVRPRQTGDEIRLAGRGITKTVKKLMIEAKIPAGERESWPILCDDLGVIAIPGIGLAERVAPGPGDEIRTVQVEGKICTEI